MVVLPSWATEVMCDLQLMSYIVSLYARQGQRVTLVAPSSMNIAASRQTEACFSVGQECFVRVTAVLYCVLLVGMCQGDVRFVIELKMVPGSDVESGLYV